jgi:hypothetical protein
MPTNETPSPQPDMRLLRRILIDRCSESDLRNFCFELRIKYADLPGEGYADKARELLLELERRNRLSDLIAEIQRERPDIDWPVDFAPPTSTPPDPQTRLMRQPDDFYIIDAASIFDSFLHQVEQMLGDPMYSTPRGIESSEELPHGGQTCGYRIGAYTVDINFDKQGIARGIQVVDGLEIHTYTLEHWPVVLSRLGITMIQNPDLVPASFTDLSGRCVSIRFHLRCNDMGIG